MIFAIVLFFSGLGVAIWFGILDFLLPRMNMKTALWPVFDFVILVTLVGLFGVWKWL